MQRRPFGHPMPVLNGTAETLQIGVMTCPPSVRPFLMPFLTPHKVAVLIVFQLYNDLPDDYACHWKQSLSQLLLEEIEGRADLQDPPFGVFMRKLAVQYPYSGDRAWSEAVIERLDVALVSVDTMFDLFVPFEEDLTEEDISPRYNMTSPVGVFIRETILDVNALKNDFDKACKFYDALIRYRNGSDFRQMKDFGQGGALDILAIHDVHLFMDKQVDVLEDWIGNDTPKELQKKVSLICRDLQREPKADWMSYLNCMRAGELQGALENLSRYFMYSAKEQLVGSYGAKFSKWVHHYARLNTALVYTRFKLHRRALAIIDQAIPLAQDMQDQPCLILLQTLQHRLQGPSKQTSWSDQQHTRQIVPHNKEEREASDRVLWQSVNQLTRIRSIVEADPVMAFGELLHTTDVTLDKAVGHFFESTHLLRGEIWSRAGNWLLATLYAQLQSTNISYSAGDDKPLGFCMLALYNAAEGNFHEALTALQAAKTFCESCAAPTAESRWYSALLDIVFQRSLLRGRIQDAKLTVSHLDSLAEDDVQMACAASFQRIALAQESERPAEALALLYEQLMFALNLGANAHYQFVHAQLGLAEIYLAANNSVESLTHVLTSISLSDRGHLTFQRDRSVVLLSKLLNQLGYIHQAKDTIQSILPCVSRHHALMRAEVELTYVELTLAQLTWENEKIEHLEFLLHALQRAREAFCKIGDVKSVVRTLVLRAFILQILGSFDEAERIAEDCYKLERLYLEGRWKQRVLGLRGNPLGAFSEFNPLFDDEDR
ncbi:hypothetical protein, variant [Spizellomyces punctatus DAOM BR117]|uniref:Anaphase-promoting complex subunit 5 n=1 Tax=Spizellomyces punctatus (strain DAOM BR117) TaxID=645134 RepID=A0A0L0HPF5_SPIPD|nr:hypothetical protein, variant [Spizellomyces punctatus DAOM BR117]KND02850.1 hypothetical protein, variant [Spizellomyces punctatus DAOM BR117]|eukprot:XP_016610889.1 hypothetical protein, variant [Spizellomyces punctatus DAOM BR117]